MQVDDLFCKLAFFFTSGVVRLVIKCYSHTVPESQKQRLSGFPSVYDGEWLYRNSLLVPRFRPIILDPVCEKHGHALAVVQSGILPEA